MKLTNIKNDLTLIQQVTGIKVNRGHNVRYCKKLIIEMNKCVLMAYNIINDTNYPKTN